MLVLVLELTTAGRVLNVTLLFEGVVSKLVPVMVTAVPGVPMVGVNPVIVGALLEATVNGVLLTAEPLGVMTLIGPVVAPAGTVVTIALVVAEVTDAATPLNWTVFSARVALKPVP